MQTPTIELNTTGQLSKHKRFPLIEYGVSWPGTQPHLSRGGGTLPIVSSVSGHRFNLSYSLSRQKKDYTFICL